MTKYSLGKFEQIQTTFKTWPFLTYPKKAKTATNNDLPTFLSEKEAKKKGKKKGGIEKKTRLNCVVGYYVKIYFLRWLFVSLAYRFSSRQLALAGTESRKERGTNDCATKTVRRDVPYIHHSSFT